MGKGHRDNHKARLKRGDPDKIACNLCGTKSRPSVMVGGLCPKCFNQV
jgi:hypothetical protein